MGRPKHWGRVVVGLGVLGACGYFLTPLGRRRGPRSAAARVVLTVEQQRWSDEIEATEREARRLQTAEAPEAEVLAVWVRGLERQRRLLAENPRAGVEQQERLERLQAAADSVQARLDQGRIAAAEVAAEVARTRGDPAAALARLREALDWQRRINRSQAEARHKSFVREASLAQQVELAEAEPIYGELQAARAAAEAARAGQRWAEARTALARAQAAQVRLNREYGRTRYADRAAPEALAAELAALAAAGQAAEVEAQVQGAERAAELGRAQEAADWYQAAIDRQREVNRGAVRSRFESVSRLEELERRRQTVLAAELWREVAALDRAAAAALRKRQALAAERQIAAAGERIAQVERRYPQAQGGDATLKQRLTYLNTRRTELRALQDRVYERLRPLPEPAGQWWMMTTELPQELYARVMSANPSRRTDAARPVESVSWRDAQECCRRLSWLLGRPVRLPTAVQWRAALAESDAAVWSAENAGGQTQPTGSHAPNSAGFFDLVGNVAEWLEAEGTEEAETEEAPVAGGSYLDALAEWRTSAPVRLAKTERVRHVGFRVVVAMVDEPESGATP